jgi:hypothetical protein
MKIIKVIAMKPAPKRNISTMGDKVFDEIKSGRNARKNIDSLGLRILMKNPLVAICLNPFLWEGELNLRTPVSCHIKHARWSK